MNNDMTDEMAQNIRARVRAAEQRATAPGSGSAILERRIMAGLEVRSERSANKTFISGYGTRFKPIRSADLGGFFEQFDPSAFDDDLAKPRPGDPDVTCLFNHDLSELLGRGRNGTLQVSADPRGLFFRCEVNQDTTAGRNMLAYLDRGDISECSIGFFCDEDDWAEFDRSAGMPIRTVIRARLVDIGPVVHPAYNVGTSVAIDPRALWPNSGGQIPMEIRQRLGSTTNSEDEERERLRCRIRAALLVS